MAARAARLCRTIASRLSFIASLPPLGPAIAADEADGLRHLGHRARHVVFVLDGQIAGEALPAKLLQDGGDVRDAGAGGDVVAAGAELIQVLQVAADDPAV